MPFTIRPATEDDAEAVHTIIQAAFEEYRHLPLPPGALDETVEEARRIIAEGRTILVSSADASLTEVDSIESPEAFADAFRAMLQVARPIGTVRYEPRPDYLYVGRLAVVPEWQGRGVGRMLMSRVEKLAPELGLTRVRLGTRESMPSNLVFYDKLGYHVVQREPHPRGPDVIVWLERELDADTPESLQKALGDSVVAVLGKTLKQVKYHYLHDELEPSYLMGTHIYIGGEIELQFEGAQPLYVSWGANKGWDSYYSLKALKQTHFTAGALRSFVANETPVWKPFVGEALRSIDILGYDGVPYALRLGFGPGNVYIGSGHEGRFGDGDDVTVCSEEAWQAIWLSASWVKPDILAHLDAIVPDNLT